MTCEVSDDVVDGLATERATAVANEGEGDVEEEDGLITGVMLQSNGFEELLLVGVRLLKLESPPVEASA